MKAADSFVSLFLSFFSYFRAKLARSSFFFITFRENTFARQSKLKRVLFAFVLSY